MTLTFVGLGLGSAKDISLRGLEIVKGADLIFFESYTSLLECSVKDLEELYGKKVVLADRELTEKRADEILGPAKEKRVVFLVVGDVFSATTHTDLLLRAKKEGIKVDVVFNASVLTAVGLTGLSLYRFGKTASVPFPEKSFFPEAAYDVVKQNLSCDLHSLLLLDIKADVDRYMTVKKGIDILLELEAKRKEGVIRKDMLCVGCSHLGSDNVIFSGSLEEVREFDFRGPPQVLIIPGSLHFVEEEAVKGFRETKSL
ncbi:diphthine synthase [Candidatus Woesearchaeota archaeon]|nr:diphthine synthase [Candidatus Woesearchaeota archaeon]